MQLFLRKTSTTLQTPEDKERKSSQVRRMCSQLTIFHLKFLLMLNFKEIILLEIDVDGTEIIYKKPDPTNCKINIHEPRFCPTE